MITHRQRKATEVESFRRTLPRPNGARYPLQLRIADLEAREDKLKKALSNLTN